MKKGYLMMFIALLLGNGCRNTPEIPAVSGFELDKYLGKWYEIFRYPNWFEVGMNRVTAEYILLENNSVRVINKGMKDGKPHAASGYVRFAGKKDTGELEVSFFRPFYSPYRIIKLAPDYRYSVVSSGNGDYLWILSRTPELSEKDKDEILHFLSSHGFVTEKLIPGQ